MGKGNLLCYLLFLLEDLALSWLALLGLDAVEELVVQVLWQCDLAEVDLGRRGDRVDLVDATQWAAVELEWTGDQEKARLELLQEDHALENKFQTTLVIITFFYQPLI